MSLKKYAQTASSASILVFVIGLVTILYIMLIPPADRAALILGEDAPRPGDSVPESERDITRSFNFVGPGLVDGSSQGYEHELGSVNLRTRTNSRVFAEEQAFHVYNSVSSERVKVLPFFVDSEGLVDNVYLSFVAPKRQGILTITLNGNPIYENQLSTANIAPIRIPVASLRRENLLEISVNGVGWAFWRKNEYIIEHFKIYGDVTDTTEQSSFGTFDLRATETSLLRRAVLEFYPNCQDAGTLFISVNNRQLFSQIPDCGILNRVDIPLSQLRTGLNSVEFETRTDTYLIDRIKVMTTLEERDDLIYYFVLDEVLFNTQGTTRHVCGEVDGVCPEGCSALDDKDCCFRQNPDGFWCTIPTFNANDRCVANVDQFTIGRCESGYEDRRGDPPSGFAGRCGDNTDGVCPQGCSRFFDKDCCLTPGSGNYWCYNLPTIGVSGICVSGLSTDLAQLCPGGYVSESGSRFNVPETGVIDDGEELRSRYKVEVTLEFVGMQDRKRGSVRVNGFERTFNTFDSQVVLDASDFVQSGNNYVQIVPQNSFNLVSVAVRVRER